jgi:hypothetical protein
MTCVPYAQSLENVMPWRDSKHVDRGFFIDVGAWSPNIPLLFLVEGRLHARIH